MRQSHGGQSYNYQILTAVIHFIKNDYDSFAIEGENFEDSLFFKQGALITIGEAKYITSRKYWTKEALFHKGNTLGPLLQLWNRFKNNEKMVLFSSIPLQASLKNGLKIKLTENDISSLVKKIKKISLNIKNKTSLNTEELLKFLDKVEFHYLPMEKIEDDIIDFLRTQKIQTNKEKLRDFVGYVNSHIYVPGKPISKYELYKRLQNPNNQQSFESTKINFEILKKDNLYAKIYFSLLKPRTLKECIYYIYGSSNREAFDLIMDYIADLQKVEFVKVIEKRDKEFVFKSTPKPLWEYCVSNIRRRSDTSKKEDYLLPTKKDEVIFNKIFDSNWFLAVLLENVKEGCMHISRNPKGLLQIYNVMSELADFFEVISTISFTFSLRYPIKKLMPRIKDFNTTLSFDEFAKMWILNHLSRSNIDVFLERQFKKAKKYLGNYHCTKVLLNSLQDKHILCIPYDFSEKMLRIERIQLTIFNAFTQDSYDNKIF